MTDDTDKSATPDALKKPDSLLDVADVEQPATNNIPNENIDRSANGEHVEKQKEILAAIMAAPIASTISARVSQSGSAALSRRIKAMTKKNGMPFPIVPIDPTSPESLERDKRATEILERFARYDADAKIRAEQYFLTNPHSSVNNQGSGYMRFQGREYMSADNSQQINPASSTEPEKIVWGLPSWLPLRKFALLAGPRKSGKTLIAFSIVARFSQGNAHPAWPGQPSPGWGNVLIYSTEDDFADTIVPRLIAAGSNMDRIFDLIEVTRHFPTQPFSFGNDDHLARLCAFAEKIGGVSLLILDPASLAIKGDASSNSKAQAGYVKIAELAKRLNAAILGIAHVMKTAKGKAGIDRVSGPLALCGVARCLMVTAKIEGGAVMSDTLDNDGTHVLVSAESNLTKVNSGFTYSIATAYVPRKDGTMVETQKIVWHDEPQGSGDELLARAESGEMAGTTPIDPVAVAIDFVKEALKNGRVHGKIVEKQAKAARIKTIDLNLAKKKLGVISKKGEREGQFSCFYWRLPETGSSLS